MCVALTTICLFIRFSSFVPADFYLKCDVMHILWAIGQLWLRVSPYAPEMRKKRILKNLLRSRLLLVFPFADFLPFHGIEMRINLICNGESGHIFSVGNIEIYQNIQKSELFPKCWKRSFKWGKKYHFKYSFKKYWCSNMVLCNASFTLKA